MKNRQRACDSSKQDIHADNIELLPHATKRSGGNAMNTSSRSRRSEYADAKPDEPRSIGWKTILAVIVMFTASIILLIFGFEVYYHRNNNDGLEMIILGFVLLLPGSYASSLIVGSYLGWDGYRYENLPSYDDDE